MEKIINDEYLMEAFFAPECFVNEDLTKYLVDVFFNKVSIEEYLSLVNKMADWDSFKTVFEKEESINHGSSGSPDVVYT